MEKNTEFEKRFKVTKACYGDTTMFYIKDNETKNELLAIKSEGCPGYKENFVALSVIKLK